MDSILQTEKECYICRKYTDGELPGYGLHKHHIVMGTANRRNSDQWGVWVWLCPTHHNMSDQSVHHNNAMRVALIQEAEEKFENLHGKDKWMQVFGRSWR